MGLRSPFFNPRMSRGGALPLQWAVVVKLTCTGGHLATGWGLEVPGLSLKVLILAGTVTANTDKTHP